MRGDLNRTGGGRRSWTHRGTHGHGLHPTSPGCRRTTSGPGLAAIGKVDWVRETASKTTTETAYYLLSTALSGERFNEVAREHWGVENRLHWRLDVVMNEDQDRTRLGNGPQNLAVLRHMALNVMQKDTSKRIAPR